MVGSFLRTILELSTGSERNSSIRRGCLSVQWGVKFVLLELAQTANTGSLPDGTVPDAMREGMALLTMFTLLGVIGVCMVAMLIVQRSNRRKRARQDSAPTDMSVDPWVEAGRRMDDSITEFDEQL